MKTINDIKIPNDTWVNLNTVAGIPVGNAFDIQNKTTVWVQLYESDSEPDVDETSGRILTNLGHNYAVSTILKNSKTIWAKAKPQGSLDSAVINVQEI